MVFNWITVNCYIPIYGSKFKSRSIFSYHHQSVVRVMIMETSNIVNFLNLDLIPMTFSFVLTQL